MKNNITLYLDDIAIELIYIEGTDENGFMMGGDSWRPDSHPIHPVCLSSYYIGQYVVTQALWEKVMGKKANISYFQGNKSNPVENVSWNDIMQEGGFLAKLNENKSLKAQIEQNEVLSKVFKDKDIATLSFQLPTEAQWEYAARGGKEEWAKKYRYSGGNDIHEVGWYFRHSDNEVHPVGLKKPNGLGIYDMSGNVFEWCKDGYNKDYYQKCLLKFEKENTPLLNPCNKIKNKNRVLRGNCQFFDYDYPRILDRDFYNLLGRSNYVGFRLLFA